MKKRGGRNVQKQKQGNGEHVQETESKREKERNKTVRCGDWGKKREEQLNNSLGRNKNVFTYIVAFGHPGEHDNAGEACHVPDGRLNFRFFLSKRKVHSVCSSVFCFGEKRLRNI